MNASAVVWIYLGLVLVGGVIGWRRAGSKISLIMSLICAVPLALTALGQAPLIVAEAVTGLLLVVFSIRYARKKKFMPGGLMAGVSLLTLATLLWLSR
jgi:uncharacterized membrane protein (UPF0136 family)